MAKLFQDRFEMKFWDHVILVFTKCDENAIEDWLKNREAHEKLPAKFKDELKFETKTLDIVHVSANSKKSLQQLLEKIKQKPRFYCDYVEKVQQKALTKVLEKALVNSLLFILFDDPNQSKGCTVM